MEFEAGSMEVFLGLSKEKRRSRKVSAVARFLVIYKFSQAKGSSTPVGRGEYSVMSFF